MKNNQIKNWAEAIFDLYKEQKNTKLLENECIDLLTLLNSNTDYISLISSLNLDLDSKKRIITEAFKSSLSTTLFNAINLMLEKGVGFLIIYILKQVIVLIDQFDNTQHGIVYSVIKLDNKQLRAIEVKMSKILKINVKLLNRINVNLIGGLKIKVNNTVLDYSISNELKEIKENIVFTP